MVIKYTQVLIVETFVINLYSHLSQNCFDINVFWDKILFISFSEEW